MQLLWLRWLSVCLLHTVPLVSARIPTAFYVDDGDTQTVPLHISRTNSAHLESKILELLDIQEHGVGIKDELATQFMAQLYKNSESDFRLSAEYKYLENGKPLPAAEEKAIELGEADTVISFVPSVVKVSSNERASRLAFNLSESPYNGRLLHAELRISFGGATKPTRLRAEFENQRVADFSLSENGQFFLNMTEAVCRWTSAFAERPVVKLFAVSSNGAKRSLDDFGRWHSFGIASYAETGRRGHGHENFHSRSKRSAFADRPLVESAPRAVSSLRSRDPFGREGSNNKKAPLSKECRRRYLYVDFKYLKWQNWVIAPSGFHAFYCDGSCKFPLTSVMNATNHAIVQTLLYLIDPKRTSEPKCAPSTLKSMKILFIDYSRNVVLKRYRDMRVEDCGCQ